MAHDADELRARIDQQRSEITGTVEQIENRIMPGRIMARRSDRIRRTLTDWKDVVMGNDEPDYFDPRTPDWSGTTAYVPGGQSSTIASAVESGKSTLQQAPAMVRRQARGNPFAAGAIALGAGWLVGSMAPRTRREAALSRRIEPALASAAATVATEGREMMSDLEQPAHDAVDAVRATGREAAADLGAETRHAADEVRETVRD